MEPYIRQANQEAHARGIHGKALTPFLLQRISELTKGRSMEANLSLLLNNARLAAQIASIAHGGEKESSVAHGKRIYNLTDLSCACSRDLFCLVEQ